MISEEEYERNKIQWSIRVSRCSLQHPRGCTYFVLTALLGIHLCRWSQYGRAHSSIFPVSNWGYSQVWRLFKTRKEELMATALLTHWCQGAQSGRGLVAPCCTYIKCLSWCWDCGHQPRRVVAERWPGAQQRLHGSALLKGRLLDQGALLLLCLLGQRDNFHFCAFLSDVLDRCEICSCFIYEKGKKYPKHLIMQIGWSNKQVPL